MLCLTNLSYSQPQEEGYTEFKPKVYLYIYICLTSQIKKIIFLHHLKTQNYRFSLCSIYTFSDQSRIGWGPQ